MEKWFFILPYTYGFSTRAKTLVHRLSFIALIFIPILLHVIIITDCNFSFVLYCAGFTSMYATYEIGYIYNDVYTVLKESKPTKWLTEKSNVFVQNSYPILISCRVVWIFICMIVMKKQHAVNILGFVGCLCLVHFVFSLHNYFRGIQNIFTNGGLQVLKYISVLLLFGTGKNLLLHSGFIYFEIAFERTIEYAISKKYILVDKKINIDNFRIIYYFVLSVVSFMLYVMSRRYIGLLLGSSYLMFYRVICKLLISNNKIVESRVKQ